MKNLLLLLVLISGNTFAHDLSEFPEATDLTGVWKLVKSENPTQDGDLISYCNGVHGHIIYTKDGYMSVALNCGERARNEEPADISNRKFFYTGTYKIDGDLVHHILKNASDVHLIGKTSTRTVTLKEDLLILTGENQGQKFSAYWEKVK